jgi:pimeloyl-ACP methyl ester carboxylesterase
MSQRGTMFSEPALTCAASDEFARELLGLRFYSEATKRTHLAATEACHRELAATGASLSAYNSTESAADLADLRKVLAIEAWNVYGTSYGSYLAQTLMRDHSEGIRSVVLDSVLPTTYTVAANWQNARDGFDNLFQACAAEPACNAAHPHLEETFTGLVNKLEAEPLTATVKDPATGEDMEVVIDGGAPIDWLRTTSTMAYPCSKGHPRRREWPLELALLKAASTNSPNPAANSGRANRGNRRKGNSRRNNRGGSRSRRNSRTRVRHRPRRRDRNSPSRAANRLTPRSGRSRRASAQAQTPQPTKLLASSCEVLLRGAANALPEKRKPRIPFPLGLHRTRQGLELGDESEACVKQSLEADAGSVSDLSFSP